MRYLGNKTKLLDFIDSVIKKYNIEGEVLADLFSGTSSVGDNFKDRYTVIANDYMGYASVIAKAKLLNNGIPNFSKFKKKYDASPYELVKWQKVDMNRHQNFSFIIIILQLGDRMYLLNKMR